MVKLILFLIVWFVPLYLFCKLMDKTDNVKIDSKYTYSILFGFIWFLIVFFLTKN